MPDLLDAPKVAPESEGEPLDAELLRAADRVQILLDALRGETANDAVVVRLSQIQDLCSFALHDYGMRLRTPDDDSNPQPNW